MRRLGRLPPTRQETGSVSNIGDNDAESAAGALDEEPRREGKRGRDVCCMPTVC